MLLTAQQLSKLIYEDNVGTNYNWYKFRIKNSPSIRTNKSGKIMSCTCKSHSVKDIMMKRKCKFVSAFEKAKELRLI